MWNYFCSTYLLFYLAKNRNYVGWKTNVSLICCANANVDGGRKTHPSTFKTKSTGSVRASITTPNQTLIWSTFPRHSNPDILVLFLDNLPQLCRTMWLVIPFRQLAYCKKERTPICLFREDLQAVCGTAQSPTRQRRAAIFVVASILGSSFFWMIRSFWVKSWKQITVHFPFPLFIFVFIYFYILTCLVFLISV